MIRDRIRWKFLGTLGLAMFVAMVAGRLAGAQSLDFTQRIPSYGHREALEAECTQNDRDADATAWCMRTRLDEILRQRVLFSPFCLERDDSTDAARECWSARYGGIETYDRCLYDWAAGRFPEYWHSFDDSDEKVAVRLVGAKKVGSEWRRQRPSYEERTEWRPENSDDWFSGMVYSQSTDAQVCALPGIDLRRLVQDFPSLRDRGATWGDAGTILDVGKPVAFVRFSVDQRYHCFAFRWGWGIPGANARDIALMEATHFPTRRLAGFHCLRRMAPLADSEIKSQLAWLGYDEPHAIAAGQSQVFAKIAAELLPWNESGGVPITSLAIHEVNPKTLGMQITVQKLDSIYGDLLKALRQRTTQVSALNGVQVVDRKMLTVIFDEYLKFAPEFCDLSKVYESAKVDALVFQDIFAVPGGISLRLRLDRVTPDTKRNRMLAEFLTGSDTRAFPYDFVTDQRLHPQVVEPMPIAGCNLEVITGKATAR